MSEFVKFPSTPHLALLGEVDVRSDKVMSGRERTELLQCELIVEEKIDGANLGLSFDDAGELRAQNRGAILELPAMGQWRPLASWLAPRVDLLFECLSDRYILFGEWCFARHTIYYDRLPDWFLAFDVYDIEASAFLSVARRDAILADMKLAAVPTIARGRFSLAALKALLGPSAYGDEPAEGLYLRCDEGDWLRERAKLVRPGFIQSMEDHWSQGGIVPNRVVGSLNA